MRTCPGDIFVIDEWYGCVEGKVNVGLKMLSSEVAKNVLRKEKSMPYRDILPGPADSSIWANNDGVVIAENFEALDIFFTPADKSGGSRVAGWEAVRTMFHASKNPLRESPGLFLFNTCKHACQNIPALPRDKKNPDDADTNAPDHDGDVLRYFVNRSPDIVYGTTQGH